jgi:beta-lactamase regulating signal transducer with metallopeptidase domain
MSLAQLLTAAALSVPAAACAWAAARALESRLPARAGVHVWRAARLSLAAPFVALAVPVVAGLIPASAPPVAAAGAAAPAQAGALPLLQPAIDFADALGQGVPPGMIWLVLALYGAGLVFALSRVASRRAALARLTADSAPADGALADMAARWRSRLSLAARTAPVRVADFDGSPFVAGLRPVIFAPAALADDPACEAAVAHELTHVKRGDERDRLLGEALAVLFWFNPAVFAIERRLAGARELACDAEVLDRAEPALRRAYAAAIARLAPGDTAATAFLTDLADLRRRRVKAALSHDGRKARGSAAALAGALVLASALPAASLAATMAERVQDTLEAPAPRELSAAVGEAVLEAQEAMQAGEFERSLALLDSAPAATAYERSVVLRIRAVVLYQMERLNEAAEIFDAALDTGSLTPEEARSVLVNVFQLYTLAGEYDRAMERLDLLLADGFEPDSPMARMISQFFVQTGDPERALPYIDTFLSASPTPSRSDLNLARYIFHQTGRTAEAEAMAARIAAMDED